MIRGQIVKFFSLLAVVWLLFACNSTTYESNVKMSSLLNEMTEASKALDFPYISSLQADQLAEELKLIPLQVPINKRFLYFNQLLDAGRNDDCINGIESYFEAISLKDTVDNYHQKYYELLGLAYLRKGEYLNCLNNHNSFSCIFPIEQGGIHVEKDPAQEAANIFLQVLNYDPENLKARWFYNIAEMAIGNYPRDVDPRFLLDESLFESDEEFPCFKDEGMARGVAHQSLAGGSILEDFNNDGFLDLFVTDYSLGGNCQYYENDGSGHFVNKTSAAQLEGITKGLNCIQADYDNDGFVDVLILRGGWLGNYGKYPNSLLKNMGDGTFKDVTEASGILEFQPTQNGTFTDFDLDGDLDLLIGNESDQSKVEISYFENQGDGSFVNRSTELTIDRRIFVKGLVAGDLNNDNWPDLYLSVMGNINQLWLNKGLDDKGMPQFVKAPESAGVGKPTFSFTTWLFDFNNDGRQDIFVSGYQSKRENEISAAVLGGYLKREMAAEPSALFMNLGDGRFEDVTDSMGLDKPFFTMGGNYGDLDNDGFQDFYLGTGEFNLWSVVPNLMFRNDHGKGFKDVTTSGGFGQLQKGHGVSFGDIDNDGDQDIFHEVGGAVEGDVYPNMLFINPGKEQFKDMNNWITLRLNGEGVCNRSAIGAKVKLIIIDKDEVRTELYRVVSHGSSFGSNSLQLEIGLGQCQQIISVEVVWPTSDGKSDIYKNIGLDRIYELQSGKEPLEKVKI